MRLIFKVIINMFETLMTMTGLIIEPLIVIVFFISIPILLCIIKLEEYIKNTKFIDKALYKNKGDE